MNTRLRSQQLASRAWGRRAAAPKRSCRSTSCRGRERRRSRRTIICVRETTLDRPREAAGGVFQERLRHRGQRERDRRRRRRAGDRISRSSARAQPRAARPPRLVGDRRRRSDADGHGAGAGDPRAARQDRADARGHRSLRDQRGVRRASISRWRRSSASIATKVNVNGGAIALGHPLGMTGTRLTAHAPARTAPPRPPPRHRIRLHRRRPGYRGARRSLEV